MLLCGRWKRWSRFCVCPDRDISGFKFDHAAVDRIVINVLYFERIQT